MQSDATVGLDLVADNPNLTFIYFLALVLLAALGLRFTYYAHRNGRASDLDGQARLWTALSLVGATATLYALLWLADVVTSLATPYRRALLLGHVLVLAFALRVLATNAIPAGSDARPALPGQWFWAGGAVAVVIVLAGSVWRPDHVAVLGATGLSAVVFATVGFALGRSGTTASRVQGTTVDTLLRHLLPVLLFAAIVPALELAVVAGLDRAVVLHVQVVFVIMTATALMTATIKLRQNLAGL